MNTIVLIGGGPSALSFCLQFLKNFKIQRKLNGVNILVLEKTNNIGTGLPYSYSSPSYLLNLPKDMMEPIHGDKGFFSEWLKGIPEINQNTQFPPRYYFGKYLQHLAEKIQREAKDSNVNVRFFTNKEVTDIKKIDIEQFEILVNGNEKYTSNYVVLCTGHMPTSTYLNLRGYPGYIHHPWLSESYNDLKSHEDVGIIGSRLTAIDIVCQLQSMHHKGKIFMISQSGMLPTVLAKQIPPYTLKYMNMDTINGCRDKYTRKLTLNNLLDLFWKEISGSMNRHYDFNVIPKSYKDILPINWLNREIKQAEIGPKPWQQVLFAVYPNSNKIWPMLSFEDQQQFMDKYYSLYMTYLAAFPLENAYKIQELINSNQLEVHGGLKAINYSSGFFNLIKETGQFIQVKKLFNATGSGYDPSMVPLLDNMINRGDVCKHPLGGIKVDSETFQVLNRTNKPNPRLYALGELTRGECLVTSDLGRAAAQANTISIALAKNLSSRNNVVRNLYSFFSSTSDFRRKENEQKSIVEHAKISMFSLDKTKSSSVTLPLRFRKY